MRGNIKTLDQLNKRLKGYHKIFRGRFLLLQNKTLTSEEFILWDLSFSVLADWDKENHPDIYGTFGHTLDEVGLMLGCSSSKVCRNSKKLFELGFWQKEKSGRIMISGFEITDTLKQITKEEGIIDLQKYLAETQKEVLEPQKVIANEREKFPKENSAKEGQDIANLQYTYPKESLSLSSKENSMFRTEEEYQRIKTEQNFVLLTIEDMKWIDKNVPF